MSATAQSHAPLPSPHLSRLPCLLTTLLCLGLGLQQGLPAEVNLPQPDWGSITTQTNGSGRVSLEVRSWPTDGKLSLPTTFPQITAAHILVNGRREPIQWVFNADATKLHLEGPVKVAGKLPVNILLEMAEKTAQFSDGRITFTALDAKVTGAKAKLESHPGNQRIGFWTDASDSVSWEYKPTRWGMYDVELAYSAAGGEGTELEIEIAGKSFTVKRPATGSWYRYATLPVGRFYLEKSSPFVVKVGCKALQGGAVANLKSVTLRPAPEGVAITQAKDGIITLASSNGITRSVTMRYEPATNKNCMGYWVNPNDSAEWQFTVIKPGTFEVELWQGCKGSGSEVAVLAGGSQLKFTVEDTGHFQNFKPRKLGEVEFAKAGLHSLRVQPLSKQGAAVMDIRQIRLIPVEGKATAPKSAVKVEVDFSQAPECAEFAQRAGKLVEEWFPRLRELLASEGEPAAAEVVRLSFVPMKGVASTLGNQIKVSADWVTKRAPNDYGMVIHELTHVVQDYRGAGEGWVTEGIADYVRDRWFEPGARRARINPDKASYRDGYTTAGTFLMWIEDHKCRDIVSALNAASRQKKPVLAVFPALTDKDVDALWQEFIAAQRLATSKASP